MATLQLEGSGGGYSHLAEGMIHIDVDNNLLLTNINLHSHNIGPMSYSETSLLWTPLGQENEAPLYLSFLSAPKFYVLQP